MRRYKHNWNKEMGITLKQAKQLCIERNKRLPKLGCEMHVCTLFVKNKACYYEQALFIANYSGTYHLSTYESVNNSVLWSLPENVTLLSSGKYLRKD